MKNMVWFALLSTACDCPAKYFVPDVPSCSAHRDSDAESCGAGWSSEGELSASDGSAQSLIDRSTPGITIIAIHVAKQAREVLPELARLRQRYPDPRLRFAVIECDARDAALAVPYPSFHLSDPGQRRWCRYAGYYDAFEILVLGEDGLPRLSWSRECASSWGKVEREIQKLR